MAYKIPAVIRTFLDWAATTASQIAIIGAMLGIGWFTYQFIGHNISDQGQAIAVLKAADDHWRGLLLIFSLAVLIILKEPISRLIDRIKSIGPVDCSLPVLVPPTSSNVSEPTSNTDESLELEDRMTISPTQGLNHAP